MNQEKKNPVLFIEAMKASGEDNNAKLGSGIFSITWGGSPLC